MNKKEDNIHQGKLNTPTQEVELVVELTSDILKTIPSIQAYLQSFKDDIMKQRKEQQTINEALLRNMTGGSPSGKPTHSTNKFKKEFCHKRVSSRKEEGKEEHTLEPPKGDYHNLSNDDSLSPCRKK